MLDAPHLYHPCYCVESFPIATCVYAWKPLLLSDLPLCRHHEHWRPAVVCRGQNVIFTVRCVKACASVPAPAIYSPLASQQEDDLMHLGVDGTSLHRGSFLFIQNLDPCVFFFFFSKAGLPSDDEPLQRPSALSFIPLALLAVPTIWWWVPKVWQSNISFISPSVDKIWEAWWLTFFKAWLVFGWWVQDLLAAPQLPTWAIVSLASPCLCVLLVLD